MKSRLPGAGGFSRHMSESENEGGNYEKIECPSGINADTDERRMDAIGGLHQTVLRSKTDAMRSERTKLIQL